MQDRSHEIQEMIDRESRAFDTSDADLMLSCYHPDMVWAWPPHSRAYDPMDWVMRMGRFNYDRWFKLTQLFFDTHTLVHNKRITQKIVMSDEQDGAFAVVDVDTLYRQDKGKDSPWHEDGDDLHIFGRACKIYTTVGHEWKMLYQPGTMEIPTFPDEGPSDSEN